MFEHLFSLLPILTMQIGGETPQNPSGVPGAPGTSDGGKPAAAPADSGGVPAGESGGGATSPALAMIEATGYYQLDPSNPESRVLGTQVAEAFNRASQFDALQSRHHITENQNKEQAVKIETLTSQLRDLNENQRLQEKLVQMGVPVQQAGVQPPVQETPQQYGGQPAAGAGYQDYSQQTPADEWMLNPAAPNAQPNNPQIPQQRVYTPAEYAQAMRPVIQQEIANALTGGNPTVQEHFAQAVGTSVGQTIGTVEEERYAREMTARTMTENKETQSQSLRDIAVDEAEIGRILAMQSQAAEKHREAELLMGVTGPEREQSVALAMIALKAGQNLINDAASARAKALIAWEEKQKQEKAMAVLETEGFGVDFTGVSSGDPNEVRKFDQKEIDADRKMKLAKAKEMMEAKTRARQSAGLI